MMMQKEKTVGKAKTVGTLFSGNDLKKLIFPLIIEQILAVSVGMVDTMMVSSAGEAATSGVSLVDIINVLIINIFAAVATGGAVVASQYLGQKRKDRACQSADQLILVTGVVALVIMTLSILFRWQILNLIYKGVTEEVMKNAVIYLTISAISYPFLAVYNSCAALFRSMGNSKISMQASIIMNVINVIGDALFIFGFHWGIKGAAWATVIGQIVSGIMVIVYFGRFRKMELKKEMFRPRGHLLKMILSLGMASCINQIAMAVVQITMNNTLRYYGAASVYGTDIPLACVGVISKVNMVFMAIAIGISQGCQPIWGYNYGAGSYDRVKRTYWKAFRVAMTVGIVFFLCFQFFPTQLVSIFGTGSKEYYEFAARYFRIFMFMTFVNGIQPMSSGFFTSIGKAKLGIVVSLTRQVIFLLPLILIFPIFMGIDGVMYAGPIADAAAGIVAIGFAVKEIRAMDKIA